MRYGIALINVWWGDGDIDTRHFASTSEQSTYFDNLTTGKISSLVNFNMGNNVTTQIVYRDTSGREADELCRCNYAVVYKYDDNGEIIKRRYFYASAAQDAGGQMVVDLNLDDIQTNFIGQEENVKECRIVRANLNRFIDNGNGTVRFDCSPTSKMFISEPLQGLAKRLTKRTALKFNQQGLGSDVVEWVNENILGWVYMFATAQIFNVFDIETGKQAQRYLGYTRLSVFGNDVYNIEVAPQMPSAVLCYPILKINSQLTNNNPKLILRCGSFDIPVSVAGDNAFRDDNKNNSYIYSRKVSKYSPFYKILNDSGLDAKVENGNLILTCDYEGSSVYVDSLLGIQAITFGNTNSDSPTPTSALFYIAGDKFSENDFTYQTDKKFQFSKSEIVGSNKNVDFNPKLLGQQFFELNLKEGSQSFTYDLQKLATNSFDIKYTEALTPDVTKGYLRIVPQNDNCIYISDCGYNYTGLVYSNDMSLMVDNDQLSQFLANNKNFYLQRGLDIGTDIASGIGSFFAGDMASGVKGITEGLTKSLNTMWTVDNMRAAPHQLANANGNAYFNLVVTSFDFFVEEYEIIENEKQIVNDFMTQFGFLYNQDDMISNYTNTRKYYNYIEADVDVISSNISNEEKDRLRQRLSNVRFWHSDNVQYNLENYETWLEEEGT